MKIAILGGTGPEGKGLAFRWAAAGHEVFIGSRKAEKGERIAAELKEMLAQGNIQGSDNLTAAEASEVLVLAVPYAAQAPTLEGLKPALAGKVLITVVAPLGQPVARAWQPPSGMSAAEEAQQQLGEGVRVVAAFQNISAHHLMDLDHVIDCDVLVCGAKKADKQIAIDLCAEAGMRGVNAGSLQNARVVEGMTAVLIGINIRNKIKNAGIRITGIK